MARVLQVSRSTTPGQSVGKHVDFLNKQQAQSVVRTYSAPFYDTVLKALPSGGTSAAETLNLFTQGIGANATSPVFNSGNKTYTDTNLQTSGGLFPQGQGFKSESVGVAVFPAIISGNYTQTTAYAQYLNDITAIAYGSYVTVGGGTTVIPLGTVAHWPAGYGITGVTGGTSTANGVTQYGIASANGQPQSIARNRFDMPVSFNATQSFLFQVAHAIALQQILTVRSCVQVAWWGVWSDVLGG